MSVFQMKVCLMKLLNIGERRQPSTSSGKVQQLYANRTPVDLCGGERDSCNLSGTCAGNGKGCGWADSSRDAGILVLYQR